MANFTLLVYIYKDYHCFCRILCSVIKSQTISGHDVNWHYTCIRHGCGVRIILEVRKNICIIKTHQSCKVFFFLIFTFNALKLFFNFSCMVLLYRYQEQNGKNCELSSDEYIESTTLTTLKVQHTKKQVLKQLFNLNKFVRSNTLTSYVASFQTTCFSKSKKHLL